MIFEQIKDRISQKKQNSSSENCQYKSIVREVEVELENPFIGIINKIFQRGRKLKPFIRKREVVAFESLKECKIYVHCIKGENVPIRTEIIDEFKQALDPGYSRQKGATMQSRMRRATPNLPNAARGGQLAMIQEGDEEGDLDEVGPNVVIRDKKDLMNTA